MIFLYLNRLSLDTNFLDAELDSAETNEQSIIKSIDLTITQNQDIIDATEIKVHQSENDEEEEVERINTAAAKTNVRKISPRRKKTLRKAKKKAKSIKYPTYVVNHLTKEYNIDCYPTSKKIKEIALETKLNIIQVNKWFTDRRSKLKNTKSNRIPTHAVNQFIKLYNKNKYPNSDEIKQLEQETSVNYDQSKYNF
jgi:hypothetical protein